MSAKFTSFFISHKLLSDQFYCPRIFNMPLQKKKKLFPVVQKFQHPVRSNKSQLDSPHKVRKTHGLDGTRTISPVIKHLSMNTVLHPSIRTSVRLSIPHPSIQLIHSFHSCIGMQKKITQKIGVIY